MSGSAYGYARERGLMDAVVPKNVILCLSRENIVMKA